MCALPASNLLTEIQIASEMLRPWNVNLANALNPPLPLFRWILTYNWDFFLFLIQNYLRTEKKGPWLSCSWYEVVVSVKNIKVAILKSQWFWSMHVCMSVHFSYNALCFWDLELHSCKATVPGSTAVASQVSGGLHGHLSSQMFSARHALYFSWLPSPPTCNCNDQRRAFKRLVGCHAQP